MEYYAKPRRSTQRNLYFNTNTTNTVNSTNNVGDYIKQIPDLVQDYKKSKNEMPNIIITESLDFGFPKPPPLDTLKLFVTY